MHEDAGGGPTVARLWLLALARAPWMAILMNPSRMTLHRPAWRLALAWCLSDHLPLSDRTPERPSDDRARAADEQAEVTREAGPFVDRVIFSPGVPKRITCARLGESVDVWIDDKPELVGRAR